MPAVAMAPAACDEELDAAAAVPLPDAALEVEDPEWSWSWSPSEWSSPPSLSVLLLHSALKLEVPLVHAAPRVSLVPVAKLTAAHYYQKSQQCSTTHGQF
jgi:hypothetical protein